MSRRPSFGTIEHNRESHYSLDYPEDEATVLRLQQDPRLRFFARTSPRSLDLPSLLPYKAESLRDRAKFLAHIVAHLYIAVGSKDLQGAISVNARDLAALRDVPGYSDVDVALETNLFEMVPDNPGGEGHIEADEEEEDEEDGDLDSDNDDDDDDDDLSHGDDTKRSGDSGWLGGSSVSQHRKSPKSAAVVNVRTWTHELLVWLKMKYEMPASLRIALAKVYYAICCSAGQHLNLKIYVRTFETLTKRVELLKEQGLVLPWRPVLDDLLLHFPVADALHDPVSKKDLGQLLRLGERASSFFEPAALPVLFRHLASRFSIPNATSVLWCMRVLPQTFGAGAVPDCLDIRYYIPAFFAMWRKLTNSEGIDLHVTSILGKSAMSYLLHVASSGSHPRAADYGLYTPQQFHHIMNSLISSLSINTRKFGSVKTKFFHGYASAIVFSLNGPHSLAKDGILDQISSLVNAVESYVHPSNSGDWSKPIAKLVYSLAYQLLKRVNMERQPYGSLYALPDTFKVSDEVTHRFVSILIPLVRTGLQSKRESAAESYLMAFGCLAHLDHEAALGCILPDLYESLEGVISTHRVITGLEALQKSVRYFAMVPVFRLHLPRLLEMLLPGIDSNDLTKTIHTLDVFATVATFVPLADLAGGAGDMGLALEITSLHLDHLHRQLFGDKTTFSVDADLELQALKASTSSFKYIVKSLCKRLFLLMENLPDLATSNGVEKYLSEILPKLLTIIVESMSDDIFVAFREEWLDFISDHTIYPVVEMVADIMGAIIKRDPGHFETLAPLLMDKIHEEVVANGAGKSRTGVDIIPRDQTLFWNLLILNSCVGNAGVHVVSLGKQLEELSFFLMANVKGPAVFGSSQLLNQMLQGVTKIRLSECRLVNPKYIQEHGYTDKCWGGFQFDDYRLSRENLSFEWFIPGPQQIEFAVATFKAHMTKALSNILGILKSYVTDEPAGESSSLNLADELRVNFLYLGYGLSGLSYLFDPSFDEDIPKLSNHSNETIGNRFKLLEQIRKIGAAKFSENEPTTETIHENLEQIVRDFEGVEEDTVMADSKDPGADVEMREFLPSSNASAESLALKVDQPRLSESPKPAASGRASPSLGGMDISSVNPGTTFRERKLYTSSYYFGDDIDTRRSNEAYLEIHRMRHLVGKSLHYIFRFMQAHLLDNTRLFKHLLFTLNIWFNDVGRERLLDHSHARISMSYVSQLQHVNKMKKPFTRIYFGSRLENYHLMRVALHATSRSMSPLDRVLLEDVVKMACSTYSSVAEPAQITLTDSMKRVNGSYGVIVKYAIRHLAKALKEKNYKSIRTALAVFRTKSLEAKLQGDFYNLPKYLGLLNKCLVIDDEDVEGTALNSLKDLCGTVFVPSSTCLIQQDLVEPIRPPDDYIDLEVKVLKCAKESKRGVYLDKIRELEAVAIACIRAASHWKSSSLNLTLLVALQNNPDVGASAETFEVLTKAASSDHPMLSRLAHKGLIKMVNNLQLLAAYDHNVDNEYDPNYCMNSMVTVDTRPQNGESFQTRWVAEMKSPEPSFYVDNRFGTGWLFWDDSISVVKNTQFTELQLSAADEAAVAHFTRRVSKQWFQLIVNLWIADANFAFQGTDVFITATVVTLMSNGRIGNMSFQDLLDIIENAYHKDEKGSHIVVCELVTGILVASKYIHPDFQRPRDEFLTEFLTRVFSQDLTPETKNIWNIFAWWTPAHIDSRRFPRIRDVILKYKVAKDSDSALAGATMLSYMKSYVSAVTRACPYAEELLELAFENADNHYEAIREQVGSLITVTSFTFYGEAFSSMHEFIHTATENPNFISSRSMNAKLHEKLLGLFARIRECRSKVENEAVADILKSEYIYCATTLLNWLKQALNTSIAVQYQHIVSSHIVPFLLDLMSMKEVCMLGNIDPVTPFRKVSQIPFDTSALGSIVAMLEGYLAKPLNVLQFMVLGQFTEVFYFRNLFKLNAHERLNILRFTNALMSHKNLEIREALANTFSGLVHTTPPHEIDTIVSLYKQRYSADLDRVRKLHRKTHFKNLPASDLAELHGAALGLGALVHAFSFNSPPPLWVPEILTILSNKVSGIPGIVGKSAKETLGRFKKTRQDTWHIDRKVFNEDQMQDLEGVLWRSYFI